MGQLTWAQEAPVPFDGAEPALSWDSNLPTPFRVRTTGRLTLGKGEDFTGH